MWLHTWLLTVSPNFFYFWNITHKRHPCVSSLFIFLKRDKEGGRTGDIAQHTETWFCGPNGSWCITEMASPPEGMTHRRMETQVTHTHIHTQTHSPIYRHTQAGLWQTVGSFLWLQNIRSWPWPKSYSYYQCGSEDTLILFYFVTGRLLVVVRYIFFIFFFAFFFWTNSSFFVSCYLCVISLWVESMFVPVLRAQVHIVSLSALMCFCV